MTKQELIEQLISNHQEIIDYIGNLSDEEFIISKEGKWTAGQQLQHILLTLLPFPKVLKSKEFIRDKFGEISRPAWDYETVLENYLKTTLKAPEQFLPVNDIDPDQKSQINAEIQKNLESIKRLLNDYLENELDTLVLPHPLLGMLTIREMIYLMSYHPLHHLKQVKEALNNQI